MRSATHLAKRWRDSLNPFKYYESRGSNWTNTCSTICALMAEFPEDSEEYKLLGDRLKAGCAAQSRQINSWSAHRVIYV